MNLDTARQLISSCRSRMDALYGRVVFDEWVVLSVAQEQAAVRFYEGPRAEHFARELAADAGPLSAEMEGRHYEAGDFEFAQAAAGSRFDAAVKLGDKCYLLCNNTLASMQELRALPAWREAQKPFVNLTEKFRADPLV